MSIPNVFSKMTNDAIKNNKKNIKNLVLDEINSFIGKFNIKPIEVVYNKTPIKPQHVFDHIRGFVNNIRSTNHGNFTENVSNQRIDASNKLKEITNKLKEITNKLLRFDNEFYKSALIRPVSNEVIIFLKDKIIQIANTKLRNKLAETVKKKTYEDDFEEEPENQALLNNLIPIAVKNIKDMLDTRREEIKYEGDTFENEDEDFEEDEAIIEEIDYIDAFKENLTEIAKTNLKVLFNPNLNPIKNLNNALENVVNVVKPPIKEGDIVVFKSNEKDKWYIGEITRINHGGTYDIKFGSITYYNVPSHSVVGVKDIIGCNANYNSKTCKIIRVNDDGTVTIQYDDGKVEYNIRGDDIIIEEKDILNILKNNIPGLSLLLDESSKKIEELTNTSLQLERANREVIQNQQELKKVNETIIENQDKLEQVNKKLIENQDKLEQVNKELIENQGKLEHVNKELSNNQSVLRDANETLIENQDKLEYANQELSEKQSELEDEMNQLKSNQSELEEINKELSDNQNNLINEMNQLKHNQNELNNEMNQLKHNQNELTAINEELINNEHSLGDKIERIREGIYNDLQQITSNLHEGIYHELQRITENLRDETIKNSKVIQNINDKLKTELKEELKEELNKIRDINTEYRNQLNTQYRNQLNTTKNPVSTVYTFNTSSQLNATIQKLTEELKNLKEELEKLKKDRNTMLGNKLSTLASNMLKRKLDSIVTNKNNLVNQNPQLKKQVELLLEAQTLFPHVLLSIYQQELNQKETELKKAIEENENKLNKSNQQSTQIDKLNKNITALQNEMNQLKSKLAELEKEKSKNSLANILKKIAMTNLISVLNKPMPIEDGDVVMTEYYNDNENKQNKIESIKVF